MPTTRRRMTTRLRRFVLSVRRARESRAMTWHGWVKSAPTVLLGAVVFGERTTRLRAAGLVLALGGIALISLPS